MSNSISYQWGHSYFFLCNSPSQLWWSILHSGILANLSQYKYQIIYEPKIDYLNSLTCFDFVPTLYFVYCNKFIPHLDQIVVDNNAIILVYIEDRSKTVEKQLKKLNIGTSHCVDLRREDYNKDKYLLTKYQPNLAKLVRTYSDNPFMIEYRLQEPIDYFDDDPLELCRRVVLSFAEDPDLGILDRLNELPRRFINEFFYIPDYTQGIQIWEVLKGKTGCYLLAQYYDYFITVMGKIYYPYTLNMVKVFFTWLYLTNTKWATPKQKGFYKHKRRLFFKPSYTSIEEFFKLINPLYTTINLNQNPNKKIHRS